MVRSKITRQLSPLNDTVMVDSELSAQRFLGLFGWTSVTYDWLMAAFLKCHRRDQFSLFQAPR